MYKIRKEEMNMRNTTPLVLCEGIILIIESFIFSMFCYVLHISIILLALYGAVMLIHFIQLISGVHEVYIGVDKRLFTFSFIFSILVTVIGIMNNEIPAICVGLALLMIEIIHRIELKYSDNFLDIVIKSCEILNNENEIKNDNKALNQLIRHIKLHMVVKNNDIKSIKLSLNEIMNFDNLYNAYKVQGK